MRDKVLVFNKIRYELIRYHEIADADLFDFYFIGTKKYAELVPNEWKQKCSVFVVADELTVELCTTLINTIGGVDHLICFSEEDMHLAATLRMLHKIPGPKIADILRFRDKYTMKKELMNKGIKLPKYASLADINIIEHLHFNNLSQKYGLPFVIKPRLGMASMNVFIVESEQQFQEAIQDVYFNPEMYMIESFIGGEMYHVDSFINHNKIECSFAFKYTKPPVHLQTSEVGGIIQTRNDTLIQELHSINELVINTLSPPNGCTHAEYFVTSDGEIYFCEIGARFGGTFLVTAIEAATGINYAQKWFLQELGIPYTQKIQRSLCAGWLDIPAPEMAEILQVNTAESLSWVTAEEIKTKVGDRFYKRERIHNRMASYVIIGNDKQEVEQNMRVLSESHLIKWKKIPCL
ncbi:ATP-grasp domain-containing protein [Fastidiosibacter lacustris]|uniref:ATP-grasp domain-containing protein n=1 Tax=Fastidiosibacter lacustris TaxID=2056695 RepID=UPI000E353823|nr:ATP-grasp domain-containing protein [Fastidiosibacter lacustris]